ncbi:glycosyltransferase [Methylobacterium variabile]|jgi:glycosyltransferase involved in cell wall biosynthesis|uniref:glycosyltransferase n=1 Tax=Methylobacterium variabile TaxID=298794 RepID=UPI0009F94D09|nr:glycosyltransferase [Methylobacterium variabile]
MSFLVFCPEWGRVHGGVSSFNVDFCSALARVSRAKVYCVVERFDHLDNNDAKLKGVTLIDTREIAQIGGDVKCVFGHDVFTPEDAIGLKISKKVDLIVFHHMSYQAYYAFKSESEFEHKYRQQRSILMSSSTIVSVGPALHESAAIITGGKRKIVTMVPGLLDAEPEVAVETKFRRIMLAGRLEDEQSLIKQFDLMLTSAAKVSSTLVDDGFDPLITIFGLSEESLSPRKLIGTKIYEIAGKRISYMPFRYTKNFDDYCDLLRKQDVLLMLSAREGFGLVAWEAMALEVPVLISKQTGLARYIASNRPDLLGYIRTVEVNGHHDETANPEDVKKSEKILREMLLNIKESKANARSLARMLRKGEFTWDKRVHDLLLTLGFSDMKLSFASESREMDMSKILKMLDIRDIRVENLFFESNALPPQRIKGRFIDKWINYPDKIEQIFRDQIEIDKRNAEQRGQTFDNNGTYSMRRMLVSRPEGASGRRENIYTFEFYPSNYERFVFPNRNLDSIFIDPDSGSPVSRREATGLHKHKLSFASLENFRYHYRVGVNGIFITSDNYVIATARSKRQLIVGSNVERPDIFKVHASIAEGMYRSYDIHESCDIIDGQPHPFATLIRSTKDELGIDDCHFDLENCKCIAFALDQERAQPLFIFYSAVNLTASEVFQKWEFESKDKHENEFIFGVRWDVKNIKQLLSGTKFGDIDVCYPDGMIEFIKNDTNSRIELASNHAKFSYFAAACHALGGVRIFM